MLWDPRQGTVVVRAKMRVVSVGVLIRWVMMLLEGQVEVLVERLRRLGLVVTAWGWWELVGGTWARRLL